MDIDIYTSRLHLRRFRPDDITNFMQYRNDPIVAQYQSWEPMDEVESQAFIEAACLTPMTEPNGQIAIALRDTDELIGDCYLQNWDPEQAEVGITLMRQYHRGGYGLETITALLNYGFNTLNFHRIYAYVACANVGAVAHLEKLGFRREGCGKLAFGYGGVWQDDYQYAMLKSEYKEKYLSH